MLPIIGFTFKGIHSSALGVYWAPDVAALGLDMENYEVIEEEGTGKRGGYWLGTKVLKRTFALACYFESLDEYVREKIVAWLDRASEGDLI